MLEAAGESLWHRREGTAGGGSNAKKVAPEGVMSTLAKPDNISAAAPAAAAKQDTHAKALSLNLEAKAYGTLAEIGAGQEVARWFLSVGAASGTVAKTMSAYDKKVSDDIYGAGTRYVSRERLLAMLDLEYQLLLERLTSTHGKGRCFFVFADTVAARNYQGTNEQHGWVGIQFQSAPGSPPNQILLHINLRDPTAQLQQQAIGVLGVNLIYAAFRQRSARADFLSCLFDELSSARIEIDVIELDGPAFANEDSSVWCLALLEQKMAHAIVFDARGQAVEPASLIRKRPLLVIRGSFSHPERFETALFQAARQCLTAEGVPLEREPAALFELTVRHVSLAEPPASADMLQTIRRLAQEAVVIVTDFPETYLLTHYLRRHSTEPIRLILGTGALASTMHEAFYQTLPGALLEGLGRLLAINVKLYVAPMPRDAFRAAIANLSGSLEIRTTDNSLVTVDDLMPALPNRHLFDYLRASGRIVGLE